MLPTPTAHDAKPTSPAQAARKSPGLDAIEYLLPTPRTMRGGSGTETIALLPTPTTAPMTGNGHARNLGSEVALIPTPSVADSTGGHARRGGARGDELLLKGLAQEGHLSRFGKYAPAIARWEQIVGPAPAPTKPGRTGKPRLNPEFASWLMGLPPGWITDTPGLTDNQALHAAGNGCVPQQVAAALEICLRRMYPPLGRIE
jgi:DNA (cytosine-5)-methyltransferase 1